MDQNGGLSPLVRESGRDQEGKKKKNVEFVSGSVNMQRRK